MGHQSFGYANEAATAMVQWLFANDVARCHAYAHPDHLASSTVAERLGMTPTDAILDGERQWELAPG